jgi:trans-2,3-dihydro-3-hydroxyanthranilic acid synthase
MMIGIPQIEPYAMPDSTTLPQHNIAPWKIDPERAVLLVHDMQRYFIKPISTEKTKSALIKNITLLRERCKHFDIPVAFTAQPGGMTKIQRGLLYDFWGSGIALNHADREIVHELNPAPEDWLITKWRYSAFCRTDLLLRMRETKRDQLIVCGIYAHIGVLTTAVDAFSNDIETFLIADAIADFSEAHHLMTLDYAAQCCAVVLYTQEVMA